MQLLPLLLFCATAIAAGLGNDAPDHFLSYMVSGLTQDSPEACRAIHKEDGGLASMHLYIDAIEATSAIDLIRVPILIMKVTDSGNFTKDYVFDREFMRYDDMVDTDKDIFKIEAQEGAPQIDKSRLLNEYMIPDPKDEKEHAHVDIVFDVPVSGIYCAIIAVPENKGISKLDVALQLSNSFGRLDYGSYMVYKQLKYGILIGVTLLAYLIYYILRFKVGSDFQKLNSVSLISKAVIFRIMVPLQALLIARWFFLFVSNHYVPAEHRLLAFFDGLMTWADIIFTVYVRFCTLLFAMGYGVIYSLGKGPGAYNRIPYSSLKVAFGLFAANIAAMTVNFLVKSSGNSSGKAVSAPFLDPSRSHAFLIPQILEMLTSMFSIVWLVASLTYYFKTQKIISSFPANGNTASEREAVSSNTASNFKKSLMVIFVMPILVSTVSFAFLVIGFMRDSFSNLSLDNDGHRVDPRIVASMMETSVLDPLVYKVIVWSSLLEVYGSVAILYFLWIRSNNGLVTKEVDVNEYDVDSE